MCQIGSFGTFVACMANLFADVIELGLPFTDPIADGPTIQKANTVRRHLIFRSCLLIYL